MHLIDTHTHIYLPDFASDIADVLERAEKDGVNKFLLPAIDTETHELLFALENNNPATVAMMGLHPCSVKKNYLDELKVVLDWLEKRPFIAVGEIGLDFYWDKTFTEQQYTAFHEQIEWAMHFNIPASIHSRNATDECITVIAEHQKGKLGGVFHCFSGDAAQAKRIIDLGLYLGIGGVITFKNAGLDKVMEQVSLEYVVLETDAPYLAPVPFRGKRNEPSYLKYVAEKLSQIKKIDKQEVAAITSANAKKIFEI